MKGSGVFWKQSSVNAEELFDDNLTIIFIVISNSDNDDNDHCNIGQWGHSLQWAKVIFRIATCWWREAKEMKRRSDSNEGDLGQIRYWYCLTIWQFDNHLHCNIKRPGTDPVLVAAAVVCCDRPRNVHLAPRLPNCPWKTSPLSSLALSLPFDIIAILWHHLGRKRTIITGWHFGKAAPNVALLCLLCRPVCAHPQINLHCFFYVKCRFRGIFYSQKVVKSVFEPTFYRNLLWVKSG